MDKFSFCQGGVKRNVKLCKEKGKETRHSESKLRHGSQHVERVAPHIELKLKMGHQPFSHFKIVSYYRSISLVLAVSSTSGFHKSFPTSSACVLLRPIVSLHMHYQSVLLDKLLSTLFTLKLSDSSVHLFVAHPNARQAESL